MYFPKITDGTARLLGGIFFAGLAVTAITFVSALLGIAYLIYRGIAAIIA